MTVGNNTLDFTYDAAGTPLTVTCNGTTYYYATNLQGDVVAILDSTGYAVALYSYDAWGNQLSLSGTDEICNLNPLRYRGYVYDTETGLYYLQSRYYNPTWGRFISADAYVSTGQGLLGNNMYAYCGNNPVIFSDPSGCAYDYHGDPQYQWAWDIGWLIKDRLQEWKERDEEKIRSGQVTYESKGPEKGAVIYNSYMITHPGVMVDFIESNRSDDITGSTAGVTYEWVVHNVAYAITSFLGIERMKVQAMDVAVGRTIYADQREGAAVVLSIGMKVGFTLHNPIASAYDLVVHLK